MLKAGGQKILPVIPQLIIPIKTALNTRDHSVVCITLQLLQKWSSPPSSSARRWFVLPSDPSHPQPLQEQNLNSGDKIDYAQRKKGCLGELILDTLQLFETYGGEDAFINIKYMVPTYESCINPAVNAQHGDGLDWTGRVRCVRAGGRGRFRFF